MKLSLYNPGPSALSGFFLFISANSNSSTQTFKLTKRFTFTRTITTSRTFTTSTHNLTNSTHTAMSQETNTHTMSNPRFLVVSLGNPAPYLESIHSAGHVTLAGLQQKLQSTQQPKLTSMRFGKKSTQTSLGPKYTLLQSPTLMNITGPWLAKAHKEILANDGLSSADMGLVVLHDDLEEEFGVVKIRKWERSHRGHNGVKSIMAGSLKDKNDKSATAAPWARISIGVGRPAARDSATISNYVLKALSKFQKGVLVEQASEKVLACLMELEEEWKRAMDKEAKNQAKREKAAAWERAKQAETATAQVEASETA